MTVTQALLKKIAEAKATAGGNLIRDGLYVFVIRKLILDQKFKGTCFIAELEVVESAVAVEGVEPNKPGSACSYVLNLDTNVSAPGNMKQFVLALLDLPEDSTPAEKLMKEIGKLVGDDQPARGRLIGDETYRKTIQTGKNAGQPFTGHRWTHVDQDDKDVASRRAAMTE